MIARWQIQCGISLETKCWRKAPHRRSLGKRGSRG